jgi:hypothetical protein
MGTRAEGFAILIRRHCKMADISWRPLAER